MSSAGLANQPSNAQPYPSQQRLVVPPSQAGSAGSYSRSRWVHKPAKILLILVTFALYLFLIGVNAITNREGWISNETIGSMSDRYKLPVTPHSGTFSIWGVIFTLLLFLHIYSLANICRKGKIGYLYQNSGLISTGLLLLLGLSYVLTAAWPVVWVMAGEIGSIWVSSGVLIAIVIVNWAALCESQRTNYNARHFSSGTLAMLTRKENYVYQIFVVNPIALFFGWTLIAAVLNFCIALQDTKISGKKINDDTITYIFFVAITALVSLYAYLDASLLSRTVFTILAYASFAAALVGIFLKDQTNDTELRKKINKFLLISAVQVGIFLTLKTIACIRYCAKYSNRDNVY